jgi:hypothetical protein
VFLTSIPVKIGSAEAKIFSNEVVLFFDNFESYSVGSFPREVWELRGKALITDSKCYSPTKSLHLLADVGAWIQKTVDTYATIVGFELHLLIGERVGYPSGMIIEVGFPALVNPLNIVGFGADGYIYVQGKKLQQYALNTWHKITVVMNKTSMKVSVWVDGNLKVRDVEVYREHYLKGFTGISLMKYAYKNAYTHGYSVYIDDVKVFTLENLVVEVYDYDGTPASKVKGTTWVELIKQGEVYGITSYVNEESKAVFTDLDPGTYYVNVWHKPAKSIREQEFWGQIRDISVEAGKTISISFTRHMPIITSVSALSVPTRINESATIEIKIKNIADIPILVEASLIIMDESGTWIYSSSSASREVPTGGTATFLFNDFKPNKDGSYYGYAICNIHGTRLASDQKGWVYLFTVGVEDRQFTSGGGHDLFPSWSADGSKLLFLKMFLQEEDHNICGNVSLWILDIESKSMKPIEEKQPWFSPLYSSLAWSPDGRRVAYSMLKMENEKVLIELYILNVSSMEKKLIYREELQKCYVPIIYGRSLGWLGNDKIVFLHQANYTQEGIPTISEIVILSESGEKLRTLVKRELETGEVPSFIIYNIFVSNKRDAIGFVEFVEYAPYTPKKGYNMSSRIWLMNVDGTNRRMIAELNNTIITSASFSQNDSIILINYVPMRENILPSLVAIDINTGKLKEVVASSYDSRSKTGFCILTDGKGQIYSKLRNNRIVYGNLSTTSSENLAEYSIWSIDINTCNKEKLISKLFPIESIESLSYSIGLFFLLGGGPAVSSDGKIAYAYPDSEGKYLKIWVFAPEKLDVKFKGEVTDIVEAIDFAGTLLAGVYRTITVKVSDVLEDPSGNLKAGMIAHVTFPKGFPNVEPVKVGDLVEVYGAFKGIEDNVVKICLEKPEHYLRNLFLVKIKGLTLIAQETPNSCWAASSEMVIKYYGTYASTISQVQIAREVGNENYYWDGMPMSEVLPIIGNIEQALERLGKLDFDREILPPGLTFDEVMNDINLGRPIIAFTKVGENWLHWVVIGGYIDRPGTLNDEVIIYNPAPVNVGSIEIIPWSNFKKSLWSFPGLEAARTKPKVEKIGISAHVDEARHQGSLGFIVKSNAWTPWYASIEKWNASTKEWNIIDRKIGRGTLTFNVDVGIHGPGNYRLWTRLLLAAEGSVNWEVTITPEPVKEATPKSEITLILQEPLHKLYLHIYDVENRHIGVNYDTNQVENEIPGANYVELNNVTVVILPPEITNFKYIVDATHSTYDEEKYNLTILTIENNVLKSQKLYEAAIKRGEKQIYDVKISRSLQAIDVEKIEETPLYLRGPILFFIVFGTGILSSGILIFLLKKRLNKVKIST